MKTRISAIGLGAALLRLLVCVPVGALVAANLPAQQTLFTVHGEGADHLFGANVRHAGDVNNDGFDDFIAGAPNPTGLGMARVHSGRDGRVLHRFVGDQIGDYFGVSVSGTGDLNNDGFDDLIVGAWFYDVLQPGHREGMAQVFSGKDGTKMYTKFGVGRDQLGTSVSGAGDVNNDGFDDFIIGAPLTNDGPKINAGAAWVYSGKDGTLIYRLNGESSGDQFGVYVTGPGDVDKDGYADLLVGAHLDNQSGRVDCGSARLVSGKDGTTIFTVYGDSSNDEFGRSVGGAGDVNGDGFLDFIVGAPFDDPNGPQSGSATVFSGQNAAVLQVFNGAKANDWFGWTVSGGADVDGDGRPDLLLSAFLDDPNGQNAAGSVTVFSGRDWSVIYRFEGQNADDWFGQNVHMGGDVNRDGYADLIIGAEATDVGATNSGSMIVLSGRTLSLSTNLHLLDPRQAGSQNLALDLGTGLARLNYWIMGSVTGTHPGTSIAGLNVPLLADSYTRVVMSNSNGSVYTNFRGLLDGQGRATATLNIPAGLPAVPDLTLYHAVIVFDNNGTLRGTSNPTSLRLQN